MGIRAATQQMVYDLVEAAVRSDHQGSPPDRLVNSRAGLRQESNGIEVAVSGGGGKAVGRVLVGLEQHANDLDSTELGRQTYRWPERITRQ